MNKQRQNVMSNYRSRRVFSLHVSKHRKRIEAEMRRNRLGHSENKVRFRRTNKEVRHFRSEHPSTSKVYLPYENARDCSSGNEEYLISESSRGDTDSDDCTLSSSFKQKLIACFVENGINNIQGDALLKVLRTHHCFSSLPKDMKTLIPELLNTTKPNIPETSDNSPQLHETSNVSCNSFNGTELLPAIEKMIQSRFDKLPQLFAEQFQIIHSEIKSIKNSVCPPGGKVPNKPSYLPFQTVEEFEQFDNVSEEEYQRVVSFLTHIGGWTARSCANNILKEAIKDEAFINVTFVGWNGKHSFQKSKFSAACEEAMAQNVNFKITNAIFNDAMTDALRSSKQRVRNKMKAMQGDASQRRSRDEIKDHEETQVTEPVYVWKQEELDMREK